MKQSYSHQPRKRFGQHFLTDLTVIQAIVQVIAPQPQETFVEIGPGLGALTQAMLKHCELLYLIEIDKDLIAHLIQQYAAYSQQLIIQQADVLSFDFNSLALPRRLRIFGNLPYNISTPLLFHLFNYLPRIQDMYFMLQKEVVDRMAAQPHTKQYGRLSVMAQYYCQIDALFEVPPQAFEPPPRVISSIVRLLPHATLPHVAKHLPALQQVTRLAFGQRRKTIKNSLSTLLSPTQLMALDLNPQSRAEALSLADFVKISNAIV